MNKSQSCFFENPRILRDKNDALELTFGDVGLTPHDRYIMYVSPLTHLVVAWDYIKAPGKKLDGSADDKTSGTWENYQEFGGLKLATDHQFGDKRIYFTAIQVTN